MPADSGSYVDLCFGCSFCLPCRCTVWYCRVCFWLYLDSIGGAPAALMQTALTAHCRLFCFNGISPSFAASKLVEVARGLGTQRCERMWEALVFGVRWSNKNPSKDVNSIWFQGLEVEGGKDPSTMSCEAYLCSYVAGSAASSSNLLERYENLPNSFRYTLLCQQSWK